MFWSPLAPSGSVSDGSWSAKPSGRGGAPSIGHTVSVVPCTAVTSTFEPLGILAPLPLTASHRSPASRTWPICVHVADDVEGEDLLAHERPVHAPAQPAVVAVVEGGAHLGAHGNDAQHRHDQRGGHLGGDEVGEEDGHQRGGEGPGRHEEGVQGHVPRLERDQ